MSYVEYVIGAYAVFAAFLLWDYLLPRRQLSGVRRAIAQRAQREASRRQDALK